MKMEHYNRQTLEALREALDIEAGRIKATRYHSVDDLFKENDEELAEEE